MRKFASASLVALLTGCASTTGHNIDFEATSARLYVEGADGKLVVPFAGEIVDIDGIGLGREAIRLVPGKHFIRHSCPSLPSGILSASDWAPSIQYNFEAGHQYVLRCVNGGLVIAPYEG